MISKMHVPDVPGPLQTSQDANEIFKLSIFSHRSVNLSRWHLSDNLFVTNKRPARSRTMVATQNSHYLKEESRCAERPSGRASDQAKSEYLIWRWTPNNGAYTIIEIIGWSMNYMRSTRIMWSSNNDDDGTTNLLSANLHKHSSIAHSPCTTTTKEFVFDVSHKRDESHTHIYSFLIWNIPIASERTHSCNNNPFGFEKTCGHGLALWSDSNRPQWERLARFLVWTNNNDDAIRCACLLRAQSVADWTRIQFIIEDAMCIMICAREHCAVLETREMWACARRSVSTLLRFHSVILCYIVDIDAVGSSRFTRCMEKYFIN